MTKKKEIKEVKEVKKEMKEEKAAPTKYVYFFGDETTEGDATMKNELGGKGANLAEMSRLGLPVPAGFTITTDCCNAYFAATSHFPPTLEAEVNSSLARV